MSLIKMEDPSPRGVLAATSAYVRHLEDALSAVEDVADSVFDCLETCRSVTYLLNPDLIGETYDKKSRALVKASQRPTTTYLTTVSLALEGVQYYQEYWVVCSCLVPWCE